jgi:hypothetical protein
MAILTHPTAWRRERGPNARQPDLDAAETKNVQAALRFLKAQRGSARKLAAAMRLPFGTVQSALVPTRRVSLRTAMRAARLAGVTLEAVLGGAWPGTRCPHCGRN